MRKLLSAIAVALFAVVVGAQDVATELDRLKREVSGFVSEQFLLDIDDPALLPSDGIHEPTFIWNVSPASRPGAVAMIVPPAVRVGRELLELRDQGVAFTESFTVRRILNATDTWEIFQTSPVHLAGWKAVIAGVDPESLSRGAPVAFSNPTAVAAFKVSEISGPLTGPMESNPGPGELWCCKKYNIYSIPGGFVCVNNGTSCEICQSCGPGHPPDPIAPLPTSNTPFLPNAIQPARNLD